MNAAYGSEHRHGAVQACTYVCACFVAEQIGAVTIACRPQATNSGWYTFIGWLSVATKMTGLSPDDTDTMQQDCTDCEYEALEAGARRGTAVDNSNFERLAAILSVQSGCFFNLPMLSELLSLSFALRFGAFAGSATTTFPSLLTGTLPPIETHTKIMSRVAA